MKYLDANLSDFNRALLHAWIDKRESGLVCRDIRNRDLLERWQRIQCRAHMHATSVSYIGMNYGALGQAQQNAWNSLANLSPYKQMAGTFGTWRG